MLVLFDIDATLITTSRAGMHALGDAGRELFGASFTIDGVDFAGRLDPLIIRDLLIKNGHEPSENSARAIRERYRRHIAARLSTPGIGRPLPGVPTLLDAIEAHPELTMGLLTGNYADTGQLKLRACGVDPGRFSVAAWGDESPFDPPARHHLPPIAIERYTSLRGRPPRTVAIIGDTPHDIHCARMHRCVSIGVATGVYGMESLTEAGADLVVADLSDTEGILSWLKSRSASPATINPNATKARPNM